MIERTIAIIKDLEKVHLVVRRLLAGATIVVAFVFLSNDLGAETFRTALLKICIVRIVMMVVIIIFFKTSLLLI